MHEFRVQKHEHVCLLERHHLNRHLNEGEDEVLVLQEIIIQQIIIDYIAGEEAG